MIINESYLFFGFYLTAEKMARRANMQNVTIYRLNNLSYEGKRTIDSEELAEKHQQKIAELQNS